MSQVTLDDVTYHVEVSGGEEKRPFLLLHGFTGSSQTWAEHLPILRPHYRVITLDILGHGRTDSPADPARYSMEKVARDVTAVLQGVETVTLLGYSLGGRLALYLAVHYPHLCHALILESASPGLDSAAERAARRTQDHALADQIERDGLESFIDYWEKLPLWASQQQLPAEKRAALRQQRQQNNITGLANSLRGMGTGAQPSLWPHLPTLRLPVLLLAGELDEKFVRLNQQMHALLPQAQLEIVAGAGHMIHGERPYSFQQALLTFLHQL